MKPYGELQMKPKAAGIQIVRKVEEEKPTPLEAYLIGVFLLCIVILPITIAGSILGKVWTPFHTDVVSGIYIGIGFGLLICLGLGFIFMKFATR
jgi:hypothetical protein